MHKQYVHAQMKNVEGYIFNLIVVYGENNTTKRREFMDNSEVYAIELGQQWLEYNRGLQWD